MMTINTIFERKCNWCSARFSISSSLSWQKSIYQYKRDLDSKLCCEYWSFVFVKVDRRDRAVAVKEDPFRIVDELDRICNSFEDIAVDDWTEIEKIFLLGTKVLILDTGLISFRIWSRNSHNTQLKNILYFLWVSFWCQILNIGNVSWCKC